jgi:outer membrane protein
LNKYFSTEISSTARSLRLCNQGKVYNHDAKGIPDNSLNMKAYLSLAALSITLCATAQETPTTPTAISTAPAQVVTAAPVSSTPGVLKIGYTNVQYLLAASPQTKVIKSQLETAGKQYERVIQEKMADLEEKFATYQKTEASMMESIKQDKQNELRNLETSIRTLQENASTELKSKENELVKPELDKIYAGINEVAKANNYTFVLNSDQVVLYAAEGTDITALVLKKLGFPEPKDEETKPASGNGATPPPAANKPKPSGKPSAAPAPSGKKKN